MEKNNKVEKISALVKDFQKGEFVKERKTPKVLSPDYEKRVLDIEGVFGGLIENKVVEGNENYSPKIVRVLPEAGDVKVRLFFQDKIGKMKDFTGLWIDEYGEVWGNYLEVIIPEINSPPFRIKVNGIDVDDNIVGKTFNELLARSIVKPKFLDPNN